MGNELQDVINRIIVGKLINILKFKPSLSDTLWKVKKVLKHLKIYDKAGLLNV